MNLKTHRLIRQLHLWIGAWGAIAAILFGISGFMQNHRGIMKLPQGDTTEISSVEVEVPESARASRETLRTWLHDTQHLDVEIQRPRGGGPGVGGEAGKRGGSEAGKSGAGEAGKRGRGEGRTAEGVARGGAGDAGDSGAAEAGKSGAGDGRAADAGRGPAAGRWIFNGGNARIVTQVEYAEGASTATIKQSQNSPLAILERLHKGVGGGAAWIILTDSFAVAMVLLGVSGILLWARGRTPVQMAFSILGVAVVVLLVIGGNAII